MNELWMLALVMILALVAGMLLGAVFFGGLWWTVQRGISSSWTAACFLGSLVLRTGIVLAGFHFVSGGRGDRLLACLLGFIIARFLVTWFVRRPIDPPVEHPASPTKETGHAA
jgi:F1F0 ATPase subunit 2